MTKLKKFWFQISGQEAKAILAIAAWIAQPPVDNSDLNELLKRASLRTETSRFGFPLGRDAYGA